MVYTVFTRIFASLCTLTLLIRYAPLANGAAREFWKQHRGCGIPGPAKDLITRMLWYDFTKRISIGRIKKHKWYNMDSLNAKDLAAELRKLHRLMEIKRRGDAEKQKQLQDSIKRDLVRFIRCVILSHSVFLTLLESPICYETGYASILRPETGHSPSLSVTKWRN